MKKFKYPKSFPNKKEEFFLKLILSSDEDFPILWKQWRKEIILGDINYAILKLIPLLYLRLKESDIGDSTMGKVKGIYKMAWYKNQLILNSVKNILFLFNKENIPVILIKGVPLLENVYKDRGARSLGDADVLIDPQHIKKAIKIMVDNGWKYLDPSPFYINRFKEPLTKNKIDKEITFTDDKNVEIDIHWSLFPFLVKENREHPMSYNEVFKYSFLFNIEGAEYRMPCMEDMIIHIIIHGAERNNHRTLRWVLDVVSIIKTMPINWKFLIERIKKFEVSVEINIAFSYLLNNLSISVPESFIEELSKLPIESNKLNEYYKKMNTIKKSLFGTLPSLWHRYWLYDRKGNFFTSWYYFIDYISQSWGITRKRQILIFIFEKYKKRIKFFSINNIFKK